MKKIIIVVVVILLIGTGYILLREDSDDKTTNSGNSSQAATNASPQASPDNDTDQAAATIIYSNDGYSPATTTVKTGDTVVIKNDSSRAMQFDSDPHPAHTDNEELNVGVVEPGESMSFVVKRTGTFGYHNHLNASDTGTIIVQ